MFRKPFKLKSNNHIKGSERKSLKERFLKSFPNLTDNDVENLLHKKDVISVVKIATSANSIVLVYTVNKVPLAFEAYSKLYPTVFLLWKFHDLIPSYTTHSCVIDALESGADFMVPGILAPPGSTDAQKYGSLQKGDIVFINKVDNKSAVAVGETEMSSFEMLSNKRGKAVKIIHIIGDKLCSLDGAPPAILPNSGPPQWLNFSDSDFPALGESRAPNTQENDPPSGEEENNVTFDNVEATTSAEATTEEMDKLFEYCFLVAIKYSKTLTLPILASNFFKTQMMPCCPQDKTLNVKKSSFKKLKTFLENMSKDGIIKVVEEKKGVEQITEINKDHPKVCLFYVDAPLRPREEVASSSPATTVTQNFIVTPIVLPVFENSGLKKGDTVHMTEIREHVTGYVKRNELQNPADGRLVKPNAILSKICKSENELPWEALIESICDSMRTCFTVKSGDQKLVHKGAITPVVMAVAQRAGNRKVTLVDNLELYGINLTEFSRECQHGVAASTNVMLAPPGKKSDQLLIQGNQIRFVYNLLITKYNIPKNCIRGLEHAPKNK